MIYWSLLLLILTPSLAVTDTLPEEAREVVKREFSQVIARFDRLQERGFFRRETSAAEVTIGEPFERHILPDYVLRAAEDTATVQLLLERSGLMGVCYVVPLLEDGKMSSALTIYHDKGKWTAGRFGGGPDKYSQWQRIMDAWPESMGYHPMYITTKTGSYFHIPEVDDTNLTVIKRQESGHNDSISRDASNITSVRDVRDELRLGRGGQTK